jgi:LmbE family N-acetylglucosaminyl deacetylase
MSYRLLAVFAHPDDETGTAGALAAAVAAGHHVTLACATRGEVGEISMPDLATSDTLGEVREAELRAAADIIGIQELLFLDYHDSGMAGTPENEDPRSFNQADPQAATGQLVGLIRRIRPDVVITFDPSGGYGHPDHIAANHYTEAAYDLADDPGAYPEMGPAFRPQRLFYAVFPRSFLQEMFQQMADAGMDISAFDGFNVNEPDPLADMISHIVDVSAQHEIKMAAMDSHQTQFGPEHPFRMVLDNFFSEAMKREYFVQARPADPRLSTASPANDLFAGLSTT